MGDVSRLETVDGGNWRDFVGSLVAVLVIGKSDCGACAAWSEELEQFLAADTEWQHVRFGKMLVDRGGLIDFKRANPWLADVECWALALFLCEPSCRHDLHRSWGPRTRLLATATTMMRPEKTK